MPETVYLTPGDEIASIKEKLDRAKSSPIAIIAPKSVKALRNPLTLKLLKRHAEFLGKEIVLVASHRTVRELASFHGLPAYSSLTQVRGWKPRSKAATYGRQAFVPLKMQRSALGMAGVGVSFLAVVVVVLLFSVGYVVVPSATITLFAASQSLSETVSIAASADAKDVDYQTGTIPGRIVEARMELSDQTDISGKKPTPDASATGQVTFVNKVDSKVVLAKGTLVGTKTGIKFRTVEEAALPATKGSSVRVAIIADQPGKVGNVESQTIDRVFDLQLANQIFAINESPTQGGTDKEVGAVTTEDRTRLESQAFEKAKNEIFQKLLNTKTPSESIYPQTVNVQIVDEQFDRKVGEETKTISIKLVVEGTALAFEARNVNDVVGKAIESRLPSGLKISSDGIKVKPLGAEKWSDRNVSFYVQGDAKAVSILDEDQIKREVAGKSKEEAKQYIESTFVLADRPDIKLEPGWSGTVPRFTWRIKINVRTP